jgi:hypothetical protein
MNPNTLAVRVNLVNKLAATVNAHAPNYFDVFGQFIDQKVVLASGCLCKKLRDLLPEPVHNMKEYIRLSVNKCSIYLYVRINFVENGIAQYLEESTLICSISNGVISSVHEFEDLKSDWNLEGVEKSLCDVRKLIMQAEAIKNTLPLYFREY